LAEIVPVVSEALEAQIRDLLPSQRGFGEDLQASNVITPIIDLTATAQGTQTPEFLQRAWDFSTTQYQIENTTTTVINNTGFWQVDLIFNSATAPLGYVGSVDLTDGLSTKPIWKVETANSSANNPVVVAEGSFVVFLRAGDSVTATTNLADAIINLWTRQVADINGNLVNPLGYSPQ
jgi:anti-sigma-K factor RskA